MIKALQVQYINSFEPDNNLWLRNDLIQVHKWRNSERWRDFPKTYKGKQWVNYFSFWINVYVCLITIALMNEKVWQEHTVTSLLGKNTFIYKLTQRSENSEVSNSWIYPLESL